MEERTNLRKIITIKKVPTPTYPTHKENISNKGTDHYSFTLCALLLTLFFRWIKGLEKMVAILRFNLAALIILVSAKGETNNIHTNKLIDK